MEKLYKSALLCGVIPLILLATLFFVNLSSPANGSDSLILALLVLSGVIIVSGFFILYTFYKNARAKQSQRNLSRALVPLSLLIINLPLAAITYITIDYASASNTIIIENNSTKTLKKMFLSAGNEKYFIAPLEPNEKQTKAILFKTDGDVKYTFNLDNQVFSGILFKNNKKDSGTTAKLTVTRTERVIVEEQ